MIILYGDGEHDDTESLQRYVNGEDVVFPNDTKSTNVAKNGIIAEKKFVILKSINVSKKSREIAFYNCHFKIGGFQDFEIFKSNGEDVSQITFYGGSSLGALNNNY